MPDVLDVVRVLVELPLSFVVIPDDGPRRRAR
jgi:hypothetical protein